LNEQFLNITLAVWGCNTAGTRGDGVRPLF